MQSLDILGCRLDPIDAREATSRILDLARAGRAAQIVTLGTEMVVYAQRDERFREIVNGCALSLCDTVGLLTVARRRGATLRERVTGVELIEHLCSAAAAAGLSIYLMGSAEGVAADAAGILETRYPGLRVAGARSGFFSAQEVPGIVEEIRTSQAQLLFTGLGSPRQEFWLAENLALTGCGVGVGVGGSFDVISGRVRRAPLVWRRLNLEWLYRLASEPKRWRRQLALPYFVWMIALDRLGLRNKKGTTVT
ncbi:MAG: WecB/TagA/CpsF family glycosyltransferase [Candidatus Eremiobacteraeota bacterium]|nr:WecB/TagA/CpsF family glycosyltransferase [Candidatus Eremiobacteraeota bacterium]